MTISLTGFMGSGKTSVGRELAARLGCPFVDLDSFVEERAGRSLLDIFATDGEQGFRTLELSALKEILLSQPDPFDENGMPTGPSLVLALGGGTILNAESAALIREKTSCIYLSTSATELTKRLLGEASSRPLLADAAGSEDALKTRVKDILSVRKPFYDASAVMMVTTDGRPFSELAASLAGFFSRMK